jgi:histidinol dehydrogenase
LGPSPLAAKTDLHQSILQADQAFVHVENNGVDMERKMTFQQGLSGNPHGNRHRTRHLLNQEFMQALLLNFRHQGKKAIEKVARNQPGVYLKILALLVPREMQVEHTNRIKQMTDEEIEQAIEAIQNMLAAQAGEAAKVIEGTAEPAALPAPEASIGAGLEPKRQRRPNRLMMQADTAVGPRERTPRKRVPSPADT